MQHSLGSVGLCTKLKSCLRYKSVLEVKVVASQCSLLGAQELCAAVQWRVSERGKCSCIKGALPVATV